MASPARQLGVQVGAGAQALAFSRLTQLHRQELAEVRALLLAYRACLLRHGIEPPDTTGAEALERFRLAFSVAGLADPGQYHEWLEGNWQEPDWQVDEQRRKER